MQQKSTSKHRQTMLVLIQAQLLSERNRDTETEREN
jgi:hypothetical protein